jgi:hypothetical protein
VKPTHAAKNVCPTPQIKAYNGAICKLEALYTKATAALLTTPDVSGANTPITRMKMGKNLQQMKCQLLSSSNSNNYRVITNEVFINIYFQ